MRRLRRRAEGYGLGRGIHSRLIETALPELVRDALSQDTRILDVYDFEISFKNDEAFISFKADTVFGETQIREVI